MSISLDLSDLIPDPAARDIVIAAREHILQSGTRVTMSDVARQAGVSRPTVYKYYRNIQAVIADVLTYEMFSIIDITEIPNDPESFVEKIVAITSQVRSNELLQQIIRNEPELLLTYQFERFGRSQLAILDVLTSLIESVPSIRKENTKNQAVFILLLVQSTALTANTVSEYLDEKAWRTELKKMLEGYLLR